MTWRDHTKIPIETTAYNIFCLQVAAVAYRPPSWRLPTPVLPYSCLRAVESVLLRHALCAGAHYTGIPSTPACPPWDWTFSAFLRLPYDAAPANLHGAHHYLPPTYPLLLCIPPPALPTGAWWAGSLTHQPSATVCSYACDTYLRVVPHSRLYLLFTYLFSATYFSQDGHDIHARLPLHHMTRRAVLHSCASHGLPILKRTLEPRRLWTGVILPQRACHCYTTSTSQAEGTTAGPGDFFHRGSGGRDLD